MKLATKISVEAKSYTGITVNDPEYRILEPVVTDEMAEVALAAKVRKNMTAQEIAKRCKKPLEETKKLLWIWLLQASCAYIVKMARTTICCRSGCRDHGDDGGQ